MTTSESKGRFFYKTNRFESIRTTNRIESIRIANWNASVCRAPLYTGCYAQELLRSLAWSKCVETQAIVNYTEMWAHAAENMKWKSWREMVNCYGPKMSFSFISHRVCTASENHKSNSFIHEYSFISTTVDQTQLCPRAKINVIICMYIMKF